MFASANFYFYKFTFLGLFFLNKPDKKAEY